MLVLACLVLPLAGAGLIVLLGRWPYVRDTAMVLGAAALAAAAAGLAMAVGRGLRPGWDGWSPVPGLRIAFAAEPLGMLFAVVASSLWVLTALYSIGYMRAHGEANQTRFHACFSLAMAAAMGAALAANLLTLFFCYEMLTFCTVPLVTHHGTEAARRAGRVYLGILLSTSILLMLPAIVVTWAVAGTLDFRAGGVLAGAASPAVLAVLLCLFAFGAGKAALMPFHRWLPAAMVAPTPVSALLHAVAVVKVGVFTILKVVLYIFGLGVVGASVGGTVLLYAAAVTILAASLVALTRDNLKERLAYSTISQLSYVILGAALANANGYLGGAMHIAMHATGKITLFFCAGAIYVAAHKTRVSELDGLGRAMPFTFAAFGLASLSIIGLPPLGGSWSKWFLAVGAVEAAHPALLAVLMLSSLLSAAYLLPIPIRAFFLNPAPATCAPGQRVRRKEAPLLCLVPIWMAALAGVGLFAAVDPLVRFLQPLVALP
jgi:multicomponent Na+:H+ antiporter subunit D